LDVRRALARSSQFFYVCVALPTKMQPVPAFYIVPSEDVAEMIICGTRKWLQGKAGRKAERQLFAWEYGGPHAEIVAKYQNKWELLALDPPGVAASG